MAKKDLQEAVYENLLAEIASRAQRTQELMRSVDVGDHAEAIRQIDVLENVVYQMGWLADLGLTNMNSVMRIHDGDAVRWMTTPATISALKPGVQHG